MAKNIMRRNLRQSIVRSLGRYIAIMAIIALGAGLFVGLLATKTDMIVTAQLYMNAQNMFDLRLLSPVGWDKNSVDTIARLENVESAEGVTMMDVIGSVGSQVDESVYQIYSLPKQINCVYLLDGRMPQSDNECLLDANMASEDLLGQTFYVSAGNSDEVHDSLKYKNFTIVGFVHSPLFMDIMRGTTTLGNGSVSAFVYIPSDAFSVDYYTEIDITIHGEYVAYSEAYTEAMDCVADKLKPQLLEMLQSRYDNVWQDGWQAYQDGLTEYEDGVAELEKGREDAIKQLTEAYTQLLDAQTELERNSTLLNEAKAQLVNGQRQLEEGKEKLNRSRQELKGAKENAYAQLSQVNTELLAQYQAVLEKEAELDGGLQQLNEGITQINEGISMIDTGIFQLNGMISVTKVALDTAEQTIASAQAALDQAKETGILGEYFAQLLQERLTQAENDRKQYNEQLQQMEAERAGYESQRTELMVQKQELEVQKAALNEVKGTLNTAKAAIMQGFVELQHQTDAADKEFAAASSQLLVAGEELKNSQKLLDQKNEEWKKGVAELEDGQQQLAEGWSEYYAAVVDTACELEDAEARLKDGKQALEDAKSALDQLKTPEVFALTRNTNTGYLAVDSNSDIVAGVSRVFPVFFLLVASLVCITTMTRMVEEERTEIGTLKALGYSSFSIMRKYLIYAGSAAALGCGLGVFVGSIVFPKILWRAYSLILKLAPDILIVFNIPLCIGVVCVYCTVILGVTLYSCRKALSEVPAQLIRPKAPAAGKKIILEHIPLWNRLSFLNKVMLRNIFRYRQRLLMMLVGIGGCTALLLTGFGIGDSIKDIVSYQFEEVTRYDIQVQFSEGRTEEQQAEFRDIMLESGALNMAFAHQSGVDIEYNGAVKNVYMISAYQDLEQFFDFHKGEYTLSMPAEGEALLSVGTAEMLGIREGDCITVRNSDMETMSLTVSGIFDNHVYNYIIISPQTVQSAWGELPTFQMVYLNVRDGVSPHEICTDISDIDDVMNVMVSSDLANQVGSMLDAMNMVVITVVICAGLLAVIVIYNLTNINITERVREIATIKVLGFNTWETAAYVFKENLFLSVIGAGVGLVGGKFLLDFVMDQIRIDMVWMPARVLPISLVASVLITVAMAILVDLILYSRLEKINMAEALKAVE